MQYLPPLGPMQMFPDEQGQEDPYVGICLRVGCTGEGEGFGLEAM